MRGLSEKRLTSWWRVPYEQSLADTKDKWRTRSDLSIYINVAHVIKIIFLCVSELPEPKAFRVQGHNFISIHLCSHKGKGVHAVGSSQQATDHSQAAAVQQQGDQQTDDPYVAVHRGGGREGQLSGEKVQNEISQRLTSFDFRSSVPKCIGHSQHHKKVLDSKHQKRELEKKLVLFCSEKRLSAQSMWSMLERIGCVHILMKPPLLAW